MQRAIALAKKGAGFVNPNPMVGCVVVKDNEIIAEGYHEYYGGLHAERNALTHTTADCKGATLYVTLEPCVMCSGAIINARMRSVYFGAYDPEYGGAGGRIDLFSKSYFGSNTTVYGGIMEDECTSMLKDFFAQLRKDKKK